jgi:hypothetical protein
MTLSNSVSLEQIPPKVVDILVKQFYNGLDLDQLRKLFKRTQK